MSRKCFLALLLGFMLALSGCGTPNNGSNLSQGDVENKISIDDYRVYVNEKVSLRVIFSKESEEVTFTYSGRNIRIEDGVITGLVSDTKTAINAAAKSGSYTTFEVEVLKQDYVAKATAEANEGWFAPITADRIDGFKESMPLGVDISIANQVVKVGGTYFNRDGKAQDVYQILKDNGVTWVRIRLWNDPYNHFDEDGKETKVSYGGGTCDLENVTEMAKGAKEAGLKVLLDFHYSDFWADPTNQVMPKDWVGLATAEEIAAAIESYTEESLRILQKNGALPDMVQIGNEITGGLILSAPGPTNRTEVGGNPYYISQKGSLSPSLKGAVGSENFLRYLEAGIKGTKNVSEGIEIMLHYAKGMSDPGNFKTFFHRLDGLDYDVIGLSYYPRWHGDMDSLRNTTAELAREFPSKKINIAEVSYGYTYANHAQASNQFASEGWPLGNYEVSPEGQARFLSDILAILNGLDNGYGLFYWGACALPVQGAGWADSKTKASWANQSLFSYDGKCLPSLNVFNLLRGRE